MALSDISNIRYVQKRHFIRINDKFIRFSKIKSIKVNEMFETDSMANIEISYFGTSSTDTIWFETDQWMPANEAKEDLTPKINMVVNFIEEAMYGKLKEYFIEF